MNRVNSCVFAYLQRRILRWEHPSSDKNKVMKHFRLPLPAIAFLVRTTYWWLQIVDRNNSPKYCSVAPAMPKSWLLQSQLILTYQNCYLTIPSCPNESHLEHPAQNDPNSPKCLVWFGLVCWEKGVRLAALKSVAASLTNKSTFETVLSSLFLAKADSNSLLPAVPPGQPPS